MPPRDAKLPQLLGCIPAVSGAPPPPVTPNSVEWNVDVDPMSFRMVQDAQKKWLDKPSDRDERLQAMIEWLAGIIGFAADAGFPTAPGIDLFCELDAVQGGCTSSVLHKGGGSTYPTHQTTFGKVLACAAFECRIKLGEHKRPAALVVVSDLEEQMSPSLIKYSFKTRDRNTSAQERSKWVETLLSWHKKLSTGTTLIDETKTPGLDLIQFEGEVARVRNWSEAEADLRMHYAFLIKNAIDCFYRGQGPTMNEKQ